MKNQPFILTLFIRLIAFPFFAGLHLVGHSVIYVREMINFFRYGGEAITYTHKRNRVTIQDVFNKLQKLQEEEK
jgi:hypothetical protein